MTRGKKLLILLIAVVVLAGGTVAALKLIPKEDDTGTAETEETSEVFFTVDQSLISEIQWNYKDTEFDFRRLGDSWTYLPDSEFPVRSSGIETLASAISSIETSKILENVDASEDFGFDGENALTICITAGNEYEIRFGDTTGISGERYCSIGDEKVYLVSSDVSARFELELLDLVLVEQVPDMLVSNITSFKVETADGAYTLENLKAQEAEHEEDTDWYYSDGGDRLPADADSAKTIVEYISGLTFSTCVSYHATEEELTEFGLLAPEVVVVVEYYTIDFEEDETEEGDEDGSYSVIKTPQTFEITLSGEYARINGSSMVYQIDSTIAETLKGVSYDAIEYVADEEE